MISAAFLDRHLRRGCALFTAILMLAVAAWGEPAATPTPSPSPTATIPAVNPYGPTVTTTATLTNVGIPEFETFYFVSPHTSSGPQLRQTPFLIKYTFNPRWEINVGGSGFMQMQNVVGTPSTFGDPSVGVKYLMVKAANAKASNQSLQLQYKFPISDPKLGFSSGRPDQQLTYFYSQDYGRVHLDVNLWTTDLGAPDGTRRLQLGQGVGITVPINKSGNLSLESEWHNFARAGGSVPATSSFMEVLYYSVNPRLTLAAGVDLGLTAATPKQTYMFGAIFLFGNKRK